MLIGGGFLYVVSPFIITNQIMNSVIAKDVSKFSLFINNEKLKENTKDVMMREFSKKIPAEVPKSEAAKYLAEKTIEAGLNKFLNPNFIINMLSSTMFKTDKKIVVDYDYSISSPNTFVWNVNYEESKNNFKVELKREYIFMWKIEKIDFNI